MALAAGATADSGSVGLPSPSLPALAAAPRIYAIVPNPLGAATWAEREMEAALLGAAPEMREEASAVVSYILLALHTPRSASAFALEMMEAPREGAPRRAAQPVSPFSPVTFEEARMVGALEAMGLTPADLVERPEMPAYALALADLIARLERAILGGRVFRYEAGSKAASLRVDPEERYVQEPAHPAHKMVPPADPHGNLPLMIFAKRVARSIYKILLGVAIGVLIWGFVRNT